MPTVQFRRYSETDQDQMQAIDQIINSGAKTHYMSGGIQPCSITFRGPNGFAAGVAAQHSQASGSTIPAPTSGRGWRVNPVVGLLCLVRQHPGIESCYTLECGRC